MKQFLIVCSAIAGLCACALPSAAGPTFVAVPGNVLSTLDKGVPRGVFIRAVDAVLREMGKTPAYLLIPTSVALNSLEEGKLDVGTAIVPLARDQERVWFSAPILTEYSVVAVLRNKTFPLARIADLYGRKIGARVGFRYPMLDGDQGVTIARYRSEGEMIRALLFGEVDGILISSVTEINVLRTEGMISKLDILPIAVDRVPLIAAFSKKSFSADEVRDFNVHMDSFKKGPVWAAILNQNGLADLVRDWPLIDRRRTDGATSE
ncbi:MAG: ABC transporter substrate-binding protein [Sulfuricella sp.]|nr:ABC transporter substrate-binding protein [Sulfuricella sp.]